MSYRVLRLSVVSLSVAVLLWGCSSTPDFVAQDEPWRKQEELACLASGAVKETAYLRPSRSALGGPSSYCGAEKAFEMAAADNDRVRMTPPALVACPMIPAFNDWIANVVEPAAQRHMRGSLAEVKVAASYGCRPMNHQSGAKLSEHGHANAIDISTFILTDGRSVTIKGGWNGAPDEQAFLREVRANSCRDFTTVLGPGADAYHGDHFHLDRARHGKDGLKRICK